MSDLEKRVELLEKDNQVLRDRIAWWERTCDYWREEAQRLQKVSLVYDRSRDLQIKKDNLFFAFVEECFSGWDCDEGSHHDEVCRVCRAAEVLAKYRELGKSI